MKRFPFQLGVDVPLYLAPMAGVSESPFRRLCRRFGADVVVTEFLSAEGIRRENEATISKLRFGSDERPIGVQIFGAEGKAALEKWLLSRGVENIKALNDVVFKYAKPWATVYGGKENIEAV